jgi:hypothetical protein
MPRVMSDVLAKQEAHVLAALGVIGTPQRQHKTVASCDDDGAVDSTCIILSAKWITAATGGPLLESR